MEEKQKSFTESKGFVLLLGALTAFDPLTIDMYLPAFGKIQAALHTSAANVELSVSTFFVGMAFGQLFYGPLSDRYGRRKPLLGGMALYFFATLGCAFAPNIASFIAFRLLQALGGCAGMVVTRAIIRDLFEKKRVASFLSDMALVMGLAPILAPTLGALITGLLGWRAIFIILAIANSICMVLILRFLPETAKRTSSDAGLWASLRAYAQLFKNRNFIGYLIPDTLLRAGMFAYISGSPFVFIQVFHIPASRYGLVFGINGVGLMLASQLNRRLLRIFSPEKILKWSVRWGALAGALVFLGAWVSAPYGFILVALFLFLVTLNFVGPNSSAGAMESQGHQAGKASALYGSMQWSMATLSSSAVSFFHDGTALPMTGMILFCGLFSLIAFQVLVKPEGA